MPANARVVGHSPYQPLTVIHPPHPELARSDLRRRPDVRGFSSVLLFVIALAVLVGWVAVNYWREALALTGFVALFSVGACVVHRIEHGRWL